MDQESGEIKESPMLSISVSSAETLLREAEELLGLADLRPSLIACSVVMMAAALEQAVRTKYKTIAHTDEELKKKLRGLGLAKRSIQLPFHWSFEEFELDLECEAVRDLEELVMVRNHLVHIEEPVYRVEIGLEMALSEEARKGFAEVLKGNPWFLVELADARRYLRACKAYFAEVINAADEVLPSVSHPE